MEILGYISTICLGLCSIPLLYKTIKDGHCKGISGLFIWCWFIGEVTGSIYVIPTGKIPLILNYSVNTIFVGIILGYKLGKE